MTWEEEVLQRAAWLKSAFAEIVNGTLPAKAEPVVWDEEAIPVIQPFSAQLDGNALDDSITNLLDAAWGSTSLTTSLPSTVSAVLPEAPRVASHAMQAKQLESGANQTKMTGPADKNPPAGTLGTGL